MKKFISTILTGAMIFGAMASMTAFAAEGEITEINSLADLQQLATQVNSGTSYRGKTITLPEDIDLGGAKLTPIGTTANPFRGTFNGNNHAISNYIIEGNNSNVGLFGVVRDGALKNITIKNATINGNEAVAGLVGNAIINKIENCDAENVTVIAKHWVGTIAGYAYANYNGCDVKDSNVTAEWTTDTKLDNGDKVGGLVGYMGEGTYSVTNCTASKVKVIGGRDVGGLVGAAGGNSENTVSFTNCTVNDSSTIEANGSRSLIFRYYPAAGGIIGRAHATASYANVTVENTTITSTSNSYRGTICGMPQKNEI